MDKITLNIDNNTDLENMDFTVTSFENFVKKTNPNDIRSLLKIGSSQLEVVLATFQNTDISDSIDDYDELATLILGSVQEFEKEMSNKKLILEDVSVVSDSEQIYHFLSTIYEAAKVKAVQIRENYNQTKEDINFLKKVSRLIERNKFMDLDILSKIGEVCERGVEIPILPFSLAFIQRNLILLEKEKNSKKKVYSEEELKNLKCKRYAEEYGLKFDDTVTLEAIEEVLKCSRSIGVSFLRNHPEVFQEKKEQYLANLHLLREVIPNLKVVVDRDPDALLFPDLWRNIKLISAYQVDFTELLCYQERALTDLSYFGVLDLMIENGYFDLKKLLDKNNTEVKKRTVFRLLGVPDMEIKGLFPISNKEIDTLLEQKSTTLKNGMALFDKCILDVCQIGLRTYFINGIAISRPKVLRNIEREDSISIDSVCCNGFFTNDEMSSLTSAIQRLNGDYQIIK